jgi:excisionase family DNA binding protein
METTGDRLLRIEDVAQVLGLTRSAVYQLLEAGLIPTVSPSLGGKARRIRASDLDAFIASLPARLDRPRIAQGVG